MHFHVRISTKSNKSHDETKLGMSEEQLRARIIEPYESGEPIVVNGKTIPPGDIARIRVSRSDVPPERLIEVARERERSSSVIVIGGPGYDWLAADLAHDVTDEWIHGPPGHSRARATREPADRGALSTTKVFVVHGHDDKSKADLEVFLKRVGLEPVVLHREANEGLTIIEKFERHADVGFACVLATPDDAAIEAVRLETSRADGSFRLRPRQNVIFEWGYFLGRLGRGKVACLYRKGTELPSDLSGLLYVEIDGSIESVGFRLLLEFKAAGLQPHI